MEVYHQARGDVLLLMRPWEGAEHTIYSISEPWTDIPEEYMCNTPTVVQNVVRIGPILLSSNHTVQQANETKPDKNACTLAPLLCKLTVLQFNERYLQRQLLRHHIGRVIKNRRLHEVHRPKDVRAWFKDELLEKNRKSHFCNGRR